MGGKKPIGADPTRGSCRSRRGGHSTFPTGHETAQTQEFSLFSNIGVVLTTEAAPWLFAREPERNESFLTTEITLPIDDNIEKTHSLSYENDDEEAMFAKIKTLESTVGNLQLKLESLSLLTSKLEADQLTSSQQPAASGGGGVGVRSSTTPKTGDKKSIESEAKLITPERLRTLEGRQASMQSKLSALDAAFGGSSNASWNSAAEKLRVILTDLSDDKQGSSSGVAYPHHVAGSRSFDSLLELKSSSSHSHSAKKPVVVCTTGTGTGNQPLLFGHESAGALAAFTSCEKENGNEAAATRSINSGQSIVIYQFGSKLEVLCEEYKELAAKLDIDISISAAHNSIVYEEELKSNGNGNGISESKTEEVKKGQKQNKEANAAVAAATIDNNITTNSSNKERIVQMQVPPTPSKNKRNKDKGSGGSGKVMTPSSATSSSSSNVPPAPPGTGVGVGTATPDRGSHPPTGTGTGTGTQTRQLPAAATFVAPPSSNHHPTEGEARGCVHPYCLPQHKFCPDCGAFVNQISYDRFNGGTTTAATNGAGAAAGTPSRIACGVSAAPYEDPSAANVLHYIATPFPPSYYVASEPDDSMQMQQLPNNHATAYTHQYTRQNLPQYTQQNTQQYAHPFIDPRSSPYQRSIAYHFAQSPSGVSMPVPLHPAMRHKYDTPLSPYASYNYLPNNEYPPQSPQMIHRGGGGGGYAASGHNSSPRRDLGPSAPSASSSSSYRARTTAASGTTAATATAGTSTSTATATTINNSARTAATATASSSSTTTTATTTFDKSTAVTSELPATEGTLLKDPSSSHVTDDSGNSAGAVLILTGSAPANDHHVAL